MRGSGIHCLPQTPLSEVARLLVEHDLDVVVVVGNDASRRPVGLIEAAAVSASLVRAASPLTAADVMVEFFALLRPDDGVDGAADLMAEKRARHLPVVDGDGGYMGMLSWHDLPRR